MFSKLKSLIGHRSKIRLAYHAVKSFLAALRYGFPARHLTVIGVTGTDGKTTTTSMIAHILRASGKKTGIASTAFFDDGTGTRENPSHLTSISPFVLQKLLRTMVRNGCTHAVLECSSHGLVQHRSDWTFPSVAAVTNTALEHLDYHGTMEQYRKDKGILFQMLRGKGTKILNINDGTYDAYSKIPSEKTIVWSGTQQTQKNYTTQETHLWLSDIHASTTSSHAMLHADQSQIANRKSQILFLPIPGTYNLENALCAISVCLALGIDIEKSVEALKSFSGIPGRLEPIDEGQPFSAYVDFAVSPQSYEKTLMTLRSIVGESGRTIVLCSSCGNRMREKRPQIGKICSELADVVIATEDETYGEDPHAVLEEVWAGIDQSKCEAHKIFDRRDAIAFALKTAKSGDAVVFCGMGPFSTMTKLEGRVQWDERKIVREELQRLGYKRQPGHLA